MLIYRMDWRGDVNTHITIDLIPTGQLEQPVTLSLITTFYPFYVIGSLTIDVQHQIYQYKVLTILYNIWNSGSRNRSSITPKQLPLLFKEIDFVRLVVFSQVEIKLIQALPSHVIEGYRIAKAVRIVHVIHPIVLKLFNLGVTLNIHKIIRTNHLKTCVFYLTKHYVNDESDFEKNKWKWAIPISEKLREFIILGNVKEFFAANKFVFKRPNG